VEKNPKYLAFVASIRAHGVTQPAIVRPDGKDGYEIISGHRRDEGSKDAEIPFTPCIVRALNDEQAIQQMVEDNVNNREIGIMELARALNMQLNSIKRQGARAALNKTVFWIYFHIFTNIYYLRYINSF
jgi:ParB/RepB/Spo0J family partition protein